MQRANRSADSINKPWPDDRVICCPAPWRVHALRLLAAADEPSGLAELVEAINSLADQPEPDWQGLMIVPGPIGPAAAIWVQPQPGNTARLWLPVDSSQWGAMLLHGARCWAASQGFNLVQAVIDTIDTDAALLLRDNGFPPLVDLRYLQAQIGREQPEKETTSAAELRFESIGQLPSPRLESILSKIQDSSLDCPGLSDVLSPWQAIEGFRHQGQYSPEHWCILRYRAEDAGLLLMAPHPQTSCWELIYMGVTPGWRGHGLGRQLVIEALSRAACHGAERLLLSVDTRNHLALRLYQQLGFHDYAKRSLYAWIAPKTDPSC
ncbi:MAG: hypothetical protein C1943_09990 [Halochromatium sp.]|nr:hypothetical protein [Halochromatium sp.]